MPVDASIIGDRQKRYRKFWRRRIAGVYHGAGSQDPRVDVYAFRPTWKLWAPARDYFVYLTGGLSDAPMADAGPGSPFSRIELSCYATYAPGFGDAQQDEMARWMHAISQVVFAQNLRINPGDTFNVGRPLAPDSEMTAFYFGFTPWVDRAALCRAAIHAEAVAHMTPISEAERSVAERLGSLALVEAFRRAAVPPVFDLERGSCV